MNKGIQHWRCEDCKKDYPRFPWRLIGGGFSTCESCGGDLESYYTPREVYQGKTWNVKVIINGIIEADDEEEAKQRFADQLFTTLDDRDFISVTENPSSTKTVKPEEG